MKKFFVVSDIHGMYREFKGLLKNWDRNDTLVILGDMIDRGSYSLEVIQYIMYLQKEFDVIVLRGNHDQMLLDLLDEPYEFYDIYMQNGGYKTLLSFKDGNKTPGFFKSHPVIEVIKRFYKEEIDFLKRTHFYYEYGKLLFTHAGFQSLYDSYKSSTENDFTWIRDHYKKENKTGLINIFGHTPTQFINRDKSNDIWFGNNYIGMDGAAAYGGQLNGLLISEDGGISGVYKVVSSEQ